MAFAQLSGIGKTYPGIVALHDIDLSIERGEVLALVGENGAGKSTLIEILAGMVSPDSGDLLLGGKRQEQSDPLRARAAGVGVVHQHSYLLPDLTVAENRALRRGYPRTQRGAIDWSGIDRDARADCQLLAGTIDVTRRADQLNAVEQQLVELSLALAEAPSLLILDEPTAALPQRETDALLGHVRTYVQGGGSVLFVSHRLEEVFTLADRIAVLRDGALVWLGPTSAIDRTNLVAAMVGRSLDAAARAERKIIDPSPALTVCDFGSEDGTCQHIDLTVYRGEIYGIYGLVGAGQSALGHALAGLLPARGDLRLYDCDLTQLSPVQRSASGLVYVPGDRRLQGMFYALSTGENIALGAEGLGWIDRSKEDAQVAELMERLRVRADGPTQPVGQLSGGNQQKVLLSRGLRRHPQVLIIAEPTQGVDVAAKAEIHDQLRALAQRGTTILFTSSDLEEVLALADRIGVMREGSLVAEWPSHTVPREAIIESALPRSKRTEQRVPQRAVHKPWRLWTLYLLNALLAAVGATLAPDALLNARDILLNNTIPLIGALGVGCIIIAGSIDISIGSLLGLSAVLAGLCDVAGLPPALSACAALTAGSIGGWLNGWLATRSRVHAIVMTLGTMAIYRGLVVEWSGGRWILGLSEALRTIAHGAFLAVPFPLWIALFVWLFVWILLYHSRFGRSLYALGSDERTAAYAGISGRAVLPWVFALCGLCIGLAGLLQAARFGQVQTNAGVGFELKSIAAAVIGGVHIAGGRGTPLGIALGVLLIGQLANVLVLLHVPAYWEGIFLGAVILSTLALEQRERSS